MFRYRALKRREREEAGVEQLPNVSARTITVPAHMFVVGSSGIVRAGSTLRNSFVGWIQKLVNACFVAAMIATGMLLVTHFTQRWATAGYPSMPLSAFSLGPQQPGTPAQVPLPGGNVNQHQRVHTQARPSNFAQYEG